MTDALADVATKDNGDIEQWFIESCRQTARMSADDRSVVLAVADRMLRDDLDEVQWSSPAHRDRAERTWSMMAMAAAGIAP